LDRESTRHAKSSDRFNRIPLRVVLDAMEILLLPLARLFELIYNLRQVPDQWFVSKTILIFKSKGLPKNVENCRSIANLCSISKIFENLIPK
jgi:hypothetical protein